MYLSINFKAIVKFSNYQRAIAAPQVAPAPKAVNTIISPDLIALVKFNCAKASGIDAAEQFACLSNVTITLFESTPNWLTILLIIRKFA